MSIFTFTDKQKGFSKDMFKEATAFLEKEAVPFAQSSLKELAGYYLGCRPSAFSFFGNENIAASADTLCLIEEGINRLASGEPPQYITGIAPFFGYDFYVDQSVLIPRFDTEVLVEKALEYLKDGDSVLDLCSGSGCIGITVALNRKVLLTALDISQGAGEVFEKNCKKLLYGDSFYEKNLPEFILGDIFEDESVTRLSDKKYDFILSNPPYIRDDEMEDLTKDVLREPHNALLGGEDGLDFYRHIIPLGKALLKKGGYLFFECGKGQSEAIKNIMRENGYENVTVCLDYSGVDRVVYGINHN